MDEQFYKLFHDAQKLVGKLEELLGRIAQVQTAKLAEEAQPTPADSLKIANYEKLVQACGTVKQKIANLAKEAGEHYEYEI